MTLSTFPTDMSEAAKAVLSAAQKFRYIRDTTGDLTWRALEDAQNALLPAKVACIKAMTEGFKSPEASETFMRQLGGPQTLHDFYERLEEIAIKTTAWNDFLEDYLQTLPASTLIGMTVMRREGEEVRVITRPHFIPASLTSTLRDSPELHTLVASFEAVGA